jgi:uncharacterized protein
MPYAPATRTFLDADSHIMELPDFLTSYADPGLRDQIPLVNYSASIVTDEEVAIIVGQGNRHSDEHRAAQVAMGDQLIRDSKEIQALGAFNREDRSVAVDLLGFDRQIVFATHSVAMPFNPSSKLDPTLRYGATRAHNRHMSDFCANDPRLLGAAVIPLDDPERALIELDWVIANGLSAVWIPHRAPLDRSPGHIDFDPFWVRLAEAGLPFLLHVGGAPLQSARSWMNNGRPATKDWLGGGENLRTKDVALLHQGPETFLSMLILDGVLHRHPTLRGGAIELGAGWVPELLRRLDWVVKTWSRNDTNLQGLDRMPSDQITQQMAFTPFVFEPVGAFIEQSNEDLFLFSSDYPHIEGGRDPIGRFEAALTTATASAKDKFYEHNFRKLFPALPL